MTLRLSAMFCYTFWREHCPGKDFPDAPKMRSTRPSRRRRLRLPLKNCARETLLNSKSLWNTAVHSNLSKSPTTSSALASSKTAWAVTISTPKWWTIPGSRTAFRRIKKVSKPRCSESLERSPPKKRLSDKLELLSLPMCLTLVPPTRRQRISSSREEASLKSLPNRC